MRRLLALFLLTFSLAAHADKPAKLEPLPEPPPPPPGMEAIDEPQVTIVKRGADSVEEYRINGRLYMVKVTPPHGVSYYLVDHKGDGQFSRQDNLDSGVRVPQWVLFRF